MTQNQDSNVATKLDLPHVEIIKEENINPNELPSAIKKFITGLNLQIKKYQKAPSEKLATSIKIASVKVADAIQDWIEDGISEEQENHEPVDDKTEIKNNSDSQNHEVQPKNEEPQPQERTKSETDGVFGNPLLKGIFGF